MPLYSMVRFGQWDQILAEPVPPENLRFWRGIAHYARGLAFLRKGQDESSANEEEALRKIQSDPETAKKLVGFSNAETILSLALAILQGEQAAKAKDFPKAISHLEKAVRMQDGLMYTEPPDWFYPVRHSLGAILLEAGLAKEAEVVYWQDLKQFPENGFSLYGVWQSLKTQGRDADAAAVHKRFQTAWAYADTELPASRF
jgi:tetratricopeptide (TPR) repeat protein